MNNSTKLLNDLIYKIENINLFSEVEDWDPPNDSSINNAKNLLTNMFRFKPYDYWIYSTSSEQIVIDAGYDENRIITIVKDQSIIYTYTDNNHTLQAKEHTTIEEMPDNAMQQLLLRI